MVIIEAKIILGLMAITIMGLAFGIPLRMLEKKFEKDKKKNTAVAVYGLGYIIFYVWILWYWFDLLGDALE